jgi:hypothetical protein
MASERRRRPAPYAAAVSLRAEPEPEAVQIVADDPEPRSAACCAPWVRSVNEYVRHETNPMQGSRYGRHAL